MDKKPIPFLNKNDSPMLFQRHTATQFGLADAVILQQLHYLLTQTKFGKVIDGVRWIYNTYEEWQKQYFPFWSVACLKKHFQQMERDRYILSCQPEGRKSRRKYYRLSEEWYHSNEESRGDKI